jgi:tRNA pseudouridine38-40 synthase
LRYFFQISYIGTHYHGWQRQTSVTSIQQVIEDYLTKVLGCNTVIIGCGRTDSGVHASQYYFHTDIKEYPNYDLKWRLNKILPSDISIESIIPVPEKYHARYDAVSRSYAYYFHNNKDPFISTMSTLYQDAELDLNKMQEALDILSQESEFKNFCRTPDKHNTTICSIMNAQVCRVSNYRFRFDITANRFLKSMIRIVADRVIKVGTTKMDIEDFKSYFTSESIDEQVVLAPPQGLQLTQVVYPYALG